MSLASPTNGRQVLANRGRQQKQGPVNFAGQAPPEEQRAPGYQQTSGHSGAQATTGMLGAGAGGLPAGADGMTMPTLPGLAPAAPTAPGQANPMFRPFASTATQWSQMMSGQVPRAVPNGTGGTGGQGGTQPGQGTGHGPATVTEGGNQGGPHGSGHGPPEVGTGHGPAYVGDNSPPAAQATRGMLGARHDGIDTNLAAMLARGNMAQAPDARMGGTVLGGQAPAGVQGQGQAVPNPVGPQTYSPPSPSQAGQNLRAAVVGLPENTREFADAMIGGDSPDESGYLAPLDPASGSFGGMPSGSPLNPNDPTSDAAGQAAYDLAAAGMEVPAGAAAGAAETLNKYGERSVDDYYDNFQELVPMLNAGRDLMDPGYWDKSQQASQDILRGNVTNERDAQLRQAMASAARGGQMGSGTLQNIYGGAQRAMTEGTLGLDAEAAQQRLAGTTAGSSIMANALAQKYGLMSEGYTSPRETFAALAAMFPDLVEAVNPAPDFSFG